MAETQPTTVRISSTSHRVEVRAEDRTDVAVRGKARVESAAGAWTVDQVRSSLVVAVPRGADLVVGTTSARVEIRGGIGSAAVTTESGRIDIEHATSVDARTASARVEVGRVDGRCRIRSQSGNVEVGSCGDVDVATKTGRIELSDVDGTVKSHCVSGRIEIGLAGAHDVEAETVSGRVSVSVPRGVRVHRPENDDALTSVDADCTVSARSVTGRVDVTSR